MNLYCIYFNQETEGTWKWLDGNDALWTNWNDGEPNGNTKENCAMAHWGSQLKWNDGNCDSQFAFVCTKPKG